VEDTPDRIVLRANWANQLIGAAIFLVAGIPVVALTMGPVNFGLLIGISLSLPGLYFLARAALSWRDQVIVDRGGRVVSVQRALSRSPLLVSFDDIRTLESRTVVSSQEADPLYVVVLQRRDGSSLEITRSASEEGVQRLVERMRTLVTA
jgi:hypothetical protein